MNYIYLKGTGNQAPKPVQHTSSVALTPLFILRGDITLLAYHSFRCPEMANLEHYGSQF